MWGMTLSPQDRKSSFVLVQTVIPRLREVSTTASTLSKEGARASKAWLEEVELSQPASLGGPLFVELQSVTRR